MISVWIGSGIIAIGLIACSQVQINREVTTNTRKIIDCVLTSCALLNHWYSFDCCAFGDALT